jgi:hypothetical protein
MRTFQFLVTVTVEESLPQRDMEIHILEAVHSWGGQNHPDDLLFPTNIKDITIQKIGPVKRYE